MTCRLTHFVVLVRLRGRNVCFLVSFHLELSSSEERRSKQVLLDEEEEPHSNHGEIGFCPRVNEGSLGAISSDMVFYPMLCFESFKWTSLTCLAKGATKVVQPVFPEVLLCS